MPLSHAGMQQGRPGSAAEGSEEAIPSASPHANGVEERPASAPAAPAAEEVAALQQRVSMLERELLDSESTHRLRSAPGHGRLFTHIDSLDVQSSTRRIAAQGSGPGGRKAGDCRPAAAGKARGAGCQLPQKRDPGRLRGWRAAGQEFHAASLGPAAGV